MHDHHVSDGNDLTDSYRVAMIEFHQAASRSQKKSSLC